MMAAESKEADSPAPWDSDPERLVLPPDISPTQSRWSLYDMVDVKLAYAPLLVCCFLSGLTDSTLYNAYGTFVRCAF